MNTTGDITKFMENQIAKQFDKKTLINIAKGALHTFYTAALVAGGLAVMEYVMLIDFGNPIITSMVVQVVGVAYNTLKEYKKGA